MDTRLQIDRARTAARRQVVAKRLAGREWERQRTAPSSEKQRPATPLLASLLERFTARTGGSTDQFARYLPRLLEDLRKNDPALAVRLTAELAQTFAANTNTAPSMPNPGRR